MGKLTKRVRNKSKPKSKPKSKSKRRNLGGCGCGATGGRRKKQNKSKRSKTSKRKTTGGSPHLEALPIRHYYPANTHENSPVNPSQMGSATEQFSGGKNKTKRNRRKVKGGMLGALFNGPQLNVSTGFGTTMGTKMLYDVQSLSQPDVPDVTKQPAGNLNNAHTPLLA